MRSSISRMTSAPLTISRRTLQQRSITNLRRTPLYVDRNVIVVNKPPKLVSQLQFTKHRENSLGSSDDNLNSLFKALHDELSLSCDPYPVHRLDKGTTGCLVLARTATQARELSLQFRQHAVEKTYLALVRGGAKSFSSELGEINTPIVYDDGRASLDATGSGHFRTGWELLASSPIASLSLLRLRLYTGHKHQLRVHAAHYLKTPILGDTLYSSKPPSETITNATNVPEGRIFLHASEVSFFQYRRSGPSKRFRLGIHAPLPEDFLKICNDLEIAVDPLSSKGGLFVDGLLVQDGSIPDAGGHWAKGGLVK